ncbi:hypothetical protein TH25_22315 [Thalassospira profundimaris]|uniref:Uncharacterized protein n=1 Tax=Thalassospira profundimaris TaxID=502049 RepID=A0A367WRL3_9PROT|nr:hypothetical protein [Thalassospira profundimaris]RCK43082.1 hypothetical protein TH25_22315 [Thalassospira profundimaris]
MPFGAYEKGKIRNSKASKNCDINRQDKTKKMVLSAPLASSVRPSAASSAGTGSMRGIRVEHAAPPHKNLAINQGAAPWLDNHFPGGSSAFWAQLLGQLLPGETPTQPAIIQKAHVSYAAFFTPYGSETSVFFSPFGLDNDTPIDLYT